MTFWDYGIIIIYMLFALSVGFFFRKKAAQSHENYFLGGRSLPWWVIGISMVATSFASDTPLWVTEVTREQGLMDLWWVLVAVLALIVGIFLFARLWRRAHITTDAEFYEIRYDGKPAVFLRAFRAFFSGVVQNLLIIGWVTMAMSTVITMLIPEVDRNLALGICLVVAVVYGTFSGFFGVVVTDCVQFFIATGAMLALGFIGMHRMGGFGEVVGQISQMPEYGQQTLAIFPDFSSFNINVVRLLIFVGVLWWNDANGYNMQRISACRDERHAVKATIFYSLFQSVRPWIWVMVALVSIVLYPTLPDGVESTAAYPMVMNEFLGAGLKGLLITAFLAAFMSTIDTHLNWGASYIMTDVYPRFLVKNASQRHYMIVTRIVVVALMVCGVLIATIIGTVSAAMMFLGYLMAGAGIISVVRWFWWRVNAFTEITALAGGLIVAFGNYLIPWIWPNITIAGYAWHDGQAFPLKVAAYNAVILPACLIVTLLTRPVPTAKLEEFYKKIRPGGFWKVVHPDIRNLPGKAFNFWTLLDILGGAAFCYGFSIAVGYSILQQWSNAATSFAVGCIGALMVYRWYKKEVQVLRETGVLRQQPETPEGLSVKV